MKSHPITHKTFFIISALLASLMMLAVSPTAAQQLESISPLEQNLLQRVAQPDARATDWRLLGKLRLKRNDLPGAIQACSQAVSLDPHNASAHYDVAQVWLAAEQTEKAAYYFQLVTELAPESEYAQQAAFTLQSLPNSHAETASGFEADLQADRFGGVPLINSEKAEPRFGFEMDLGWVYNSNVQLAPLSRVVTTQGLASHQGFWAPRTKYRFLDNELWQGGLSFDGYFSVNEAAYNNFNVQEYQPGAFLEHSYFTASSELVTRIEYNYSLNYFSGSEYANRNSITTVFSVIRPFSESLVSWTIDYSNFADDGTTPSISSLDGWTNTLSASHTIFPDESRWSSWAIGADVQLAALVGDDYVYRGTFLFTEGTLTLPWQSQLVTQLGWGYRD
jgi:tetratricopeptide (TPR) repeat protein